jgi:uncharacterized protein
MFGRTLIAALLLALLLAAAPAAGASTPGGPLLAEAVKRGDMEGVRALLRRKADVNAAEGDGMTALHWAAYRDDVEMLKLLLAAGADFRAATRVGALTPLFLACANGNPVAVEALLRAGADANSRNANGTAALMTAASAGNPAAVRVLLDRGAEVNAREAARGQTALMFAAALNRVGVIRLLLARGADPGIATPTRDVDKVSFDRDSHIYYHPPPAQPGAEGAKKDEAAVARAAAEAAQAAGAAARSDLELLGRALGFNSAQSLPGKQRAAGARRSPPMRVGPEFAGGMTALLYAAREGQADAVGALLDGGADINQSSADKFSPLLMAVVNGHLDLALELLGRGAKPNLAAVTGLTALYATVDVQWAPHASYPQPRVEQERTSYLELMKALLKGGADPNARLGAKPWFRSLFSDPTWVDPAGATAFWRAAQSSDITALRLLKEHGADPSIATKSGNTPLMAAAGVGWASNWSVNAPVSPFEAIKYCVELGNDVNAVDGRGYTPLHGAAYVGNNEMVLYLVEKGAKVDARSKAGDSPADMANGPWRFGLPHPETVALLEKLGSPNANNCRSDKCVVAAKPLSPAEQAQKEALEKFAAVLGLRSAVYLAEAKATPGGN